MTTLKKGALYTPSVLWLGQSCPLYAGWNSFGVFFPCAFAFFHSSLSFLGDILALETEWIMGCTAVKPFVSEGNMLGGFRAEPHFGQQGGGNFASFMLVCHPHPTRRGNKGSIPIDIPRPHVFFRAGELYNHLDSWKNISSTTPQNRTLQWVLINKSA